MRIADVLSPERMTVSLEATDKPSALRAIARLFPQRDPAEVYRVFAEREALASTGVGSGVAIPHGRLVDVDRLEAAFAVHRTGVPFEAVDEQPARLFIALLAPVHQAGEHLKALARFSRLLRQESIREALLQAESSEDALAVLLQQEPPARP